MAESLVACGTADFCISRPFAFLGPRYDPVLKTIYTTVSQRDIFRRRRLLRALFSDALSDTTPLYKLTNRYVDRPLLDAIAAEYAKGRLLLVGTTDLDKLEPTVACHPDPGQRKNAKEMNVKLDRAYVGSCTGG